MDKEIEKLCDREIQYLREILSQLSLEQELLLAKNFSRHEKIQKALLKTKHEMRTIILKRNKLLLDRRLDAYYAEQIQLLRDKILEQRKENIALIKQAKGMNLPLTPQILQETEGKKGPSVLVKEKKPPMD